MGRGRDCVDHRQQERCREEVESSSDGDGSRPVLVPVWAAMWQLAAGRGLWQPGQDNVGRDKHTLPVAVAAQLTSREHTHTHTHLIYCGHTIPYC